MRHAVIVLAAVSCLSVFSLAQTAEELVNKNIEAKGGIDKIKAIHSVRMTGKLNGGGGFTASQGQENQRPNLVRETFSLQGMTAITAYDGATGWQIQPFGGHKDPQLMGEDDLKDLLLDAELRARMERLGLQRAARFSWRATAQKTLEVYREVAERHRAATREYVHR